MALFPVLCIYAGKVLVLIQPRLATEYTDCLTTLLLILINLQALWWRGPQEAGDGGFI